MIAMAGMNPMRWLEEISSPPSRGMTAVAQRRVDIAADERQDLAERIIDVLGKSMKWVTWAQTAT
jgi:hypothetical protein